MRRLAKKHVLNYGTRGGNVFIHEEIARSQLGMNLKAICQQSTNIASRSQKSQIKIYEQLDYLVGSMVIKAGLAPNLCEMLFLVQSLILVQIVSLLVLNGSVAYKRQAEKRQYVLHLWTGKLWNMAPSELPASLSPRQAFLLAESVRRTIIISGEFQGLWHASKYAWVEHNMFLDSLPFERRAQLWEVPETGFDTAFGNGKQDIISWRELIDIFDAGMLSTFTSFETMLLVALRGKHAIEAQLKAMSIC
ncbi:hypothetical protein H2198_010422 [Neophaeococcomyces mojaviensis]|uniref:Uncharacterized protein n=1 Tax=Neophaeococcomyces mojaviensis TaxID=3383035 RepID=A0ACC2ZRV4_9EURO|nr:hypothetical protein H2198_010422 [Knufia sp. JES_112]